MIADGDMTDEEERRLVAEGNQLQSRMAEATRLLSRECEGVPDGHHPREVVRRLENLHRDLLPEALAKIADVLDGVEEAARHLR